MDGIRLRYHRSKATIEHHPWVMSGAVHSVHGQFTPGDIVDVYSYEGQLLARGHYSPNADVRVRILTWNDNETIDENFYRKRIADAVARRKPLLNSDETDSCRLVHAESDMLPGLIVDKYADSLVMQCLTAGMDRIKHDLAKFLLEITGCCGVFEKSNHPARKHECLEISEGQLLGDIPINPLQIRENGLIFEVDIVAGQKTGYYMDQRKNRQETAQLAAKQHLLDVFSYTGSFSVYAAASGADAITRLDASKMALKLGRRNLELNASKTNITDESILGDAFTELRKLRKSDRRFGMIVLDPPKMAGKKQQLKRATRAYKDLNLQAIKLAEPDGILATFSCSGALSPAHFRTILWRAARDARREIQILRVLSHDIDHAVRVSFPESEYLKGLICRVL